jgi:malate dehydrogenase (oxaloacetate-decarboxylating)
MENQTMTLAEKALLMHEKWNGKLETIAKSKVNSREDLAIAYTPGVAEPCKVIAKDPEAAYKYTMKANTVAVISDGSAVLGLGNIGAYAAMPVMEGKCVLFKEFGDVNAVPICLDTQDTEEIIATIKNIAPAYGGINLEDISAPRCFEIEERLKEMLDIPVFHDRHRCACRHYQRSACYRQEKRGLPRRRKRCRFRGRCHHKASAHLRFSPCHHV